MSDVFERDEEISTWQGGEIPVEQLKEHLFLECAKQGVNYKKMLQLIQKESAWS